ncbi:MAG: polysaccharide deacetylase family protein [Microthrixaceae bacterium]
MQRRAFLRRGVGIGLGGLGVGVIGGGMGGSKREHLQSVSQRESAQYGRTGRGAAQVVWSVATDEHAVALTFDDGPHPRLTPRVLDVLADHDVRATFFLIGTAALRHPALVRRLLDDGHEVGNHSWSHASIALLDGDEAREEVLRGSDSLARLTGQRPEWFRPPRGMLTGSILRATADLEQDVALWSVRTPPGSNRSSPRDVTEHLLGALRPGSIYCLHDGTSGREHEAELERRRETELAALPDFLARATEQRYSFRTLTDLSTRSADV